MNKINAFKILFLDRYKNYDVIEVITKKKLNFSNNFEFGYDNENYIVNIKNINKSYKVKKEKLEFYKKVNKKGENKFEKNNRIIDEILNEIFNDKNLELRQKKNGKKFYFTNIKKLIYLIPILGFILLNHNQSTNLLFILPSFFALYFFNKIYYLQYIILIIISLLYPNIYLLTFIVCHFFYQFFEKDIIYSNFIKFSLTLMCCYIIFHNGDLNLDDFLFVLLLTAISIPFIFWLNTKYLYEDRIIIIMIMLIIPLNVQNFSGMNIVLMLFFLLFSRELIQIVLKKKYSET